MLPIPGARLPAGADTDYVARESVAPLQQQHNVGTARLNGLNNVKSLIVSDYFADSNNVNEVFILGCSVKPWWNRRV